MRLLRKFSRTSPARRRLLPESIVSVAIVRIALRFLPLRQWENFAERLRRSRGSETAQCPTPDDVAWAVQRVSRLVPRATCLTQAVAAQLVLAHRGHASLLRIGVARAADGQLGAHAWLESGGRILLGRDAAAFTPLAATSPALPVYTATSALAVGRPDHR